MEFIAAKCPNCAGELRVPDNRNNVVCMYCGIDVLVSEARRNSGDELENLRTLAEEAERGRAYDDAYDYWKRVRAIVPSDFNALVGQAVTAELLQKYDIETLRQTGPSSLVDTVRERISAAEPGADQPRLKQIAAADSRHIRFAGIS